MVDEEKLKELKERIQTAKSLNKSQQKTKRLSTTGFEPVADRSK